MKKIQVSLRLKEISKHVSKASFFADIGSDHAYLPTYVCLNDEKASAIAGEVNKGPFNKAKEVVSAYQLADRIVVRLGNGLAVLEEDNLDTLVIAGMGGKLIESILTEELDKTLKINKLILQPNLDADRLRKWLIKYNYNLTHEKVIEENNHFYEILVAEKTNDMNPYQENVDLDKQIFFGPLLLKNRPTEFFKKWKEEEQNLRRIIKEMKQAKKINYIKLKQFEERLIWIEEVLYNE